MPLPFSDHDADESQQATSDYFWMLRLGILEENTRASWRWFRRGYTTMSAFYREECPGVPTEPPPRGVQEAA